MQADSTSCIVVNFPTSSAGPAIHARPSRERLDSWVRRYGASSNSYVLLEGFIVCEPIYGRNGYYLDVTRRRADAVRGTMELLTAEILRLLSAEGCDMVSMGLAPLALLDDPDLVDHPLLTRLMRFVYHRVNVTYELQLYQQQNATNQPLVLFTSGDGGWSPFCADIAAHIAASGSTVVGIDAKDYLVKFASPQKP